jgi:hypothetical protein
MEPELQLIKPDFRSLANSLALGAWNALSCTPNACDTQANMALVNNKLSVNTSVATSISRGPERVSRITGGL